MAERDEGNEVIEGKGAIYLFSPLSLLALFLFSLSLLLGFALALWAREGKRRR